VRDMLPVIAIFAFLALVVWWEAGLWNECLDGHSFWYCFRVLGK